MIQFTLDDREFTEAWWKRCLADPAKLAAWLQKLQRTELAGYTDHKDFMQANPNLGERESKILTNIANDELRHSGLLVDLMTDRGIPVVYAGPMSTYWDTVLGSVVDLAGYCAANYYGEALASYRFEVMQAMPETPSDIRRVLDSVLPDEIWHRVTLLRMSTPHALKLWGVRHEAAVAALRQGAPA